MSQDAEKTVDDMTNEELVEKLVRVENENQHLKDRNKTLANELQSVRDAWHVINDTLTNRFTSTQKDILEDMVSETIDDRISGLTVEVEGTLEGRLY